MASRFAKIVGAQLKKAAKGNDENIVLLGDPEGDARVVYVLISGLPQRNFRGECIFKLTLPGEFPQKAPTLTCLTENGLYKVGGMICISVGAFHNGDRAADGSAGWRPGGGLCWFVKEIMNGLVCPEGLNHSKHPDNNQGGLGILDSTYSKCADLARASRAYNRVRNTALRRHFHEYACGAGKDLAACVTWRRQEAKSDILDNQACADNQAFAAAFGEEFLTSILGGGRRWGCKAGFHLALACRLASLDTDLFRIAWAAAVVLGTEEKADNRLHAWDDYVEAISFFAPHSSGVRVLGASPELAGCLTGLVTCIMNSDFPGRDAALGDLQSGSVDGWVAAENNAGYPPPQEPR